MAYTFHVDADSVRQIERLVSTANKLWRLTKTKGLHTTPGASWVLPENTYISPAYQEFSHLWNQNHPNTYNFPTVRDGQVFVHRHRPPSMALFRLHSNDSPHRNPQLRQQENRPRGREHPRSPTRIPAKRLYECALHSLVLKGEQELEEARQAAKRDREEFQERSDAYSPPLRRHSSSAHRDSQDRTSAKRYREDDRPSSTRTHHHGRSLGLHGRSPSPGPSGFGRLYSGDRESEAHLAPVAEGERGWPSFDFRPSLPHHLAHGQPGPSTPPPVGLPRGTSHTQPRAPEGSADISMVDFWGTQTPGPLLDAWSAPPVVVPPQVPPFVPQRHGNSNEDNAPLHAFPASSGFPQRVVAPRGAPIAVWVSSSNGVLGGEPRQAHVASGSNSTRELPGASRNRTPPANERSSADATPPPGHATGGRSYPGAE